MNNYPFIKKLNDKLNNFKSYKKIINLIKTIEENKAIILFEKIKALKTIKVNKLANHITKKRKYIMTASIIILSGGLIYFNSFNKNNSIVEKNSISKSNIEPNTLRSQENINEKLNISQTKENNNEQINISQIKDNNEQINITSIEEKNIYKSKIEEKSASDLLSPLISPSELDAAIPKGRMDPFNKTNNLSLGDSNNVYLDLKVYGVISVKDKIYVLTKSELGSALICPKGRGKCDKFSSNILPKGWELIDIDINNGCANFQNSKSSEKSICMSSL